MKKDDIICQLTDSFTIVLSKCGLVDGKHFTSLFEGDRREEFKLWKDLRDYWETQHER